MSLLDDARRDLYVTLPMNPTRTEFAQICRPCGRVEGDHDPSCSVLRILAALEAAERVVQMLTPVPGHPQPTVSNAEAALLDLEVAMRGERVPA